jgi:Sec-independent protein translocase protein TatA
MDVSTPTILGVGAFILLGPKKARDLLRQAARLHAQWKHVTSELAAKIEMETVDPPPEAMVRGAKPVQTEAIVLTPPPPGVVLRMSGETVEEDSCER